MGRPYFAITAPPVGALINSRTRDFGQTGEKGDGCEREREEK